MLCLNSKTELIITYLRVLGLELLVFLYVNILLSFSAEKIGVVYYVTL